MRADMAKVIVERPRLGSWLPSHQKGYRKYLQKTDVENLPRYEPLPGCWHGRQKSLNENLAPLHRFLRSQVGRPWNKVHQDLCEHVSFDNAVQMHVLTHVFDFLARYVDMIDGWPHSRRGRPLEPGQMYVCPRTGLLKVVRPSKRRPPQLRHIVGRLRQLHFRDGHWWDVRVRELPADPGDLWDVWLERDVAKLTVQAAKTAYGAKLFAISKRPLSRREARTLLREVSGASRKV